MAWQAISFSEQLQQGDKVLVKVSYFPIPFLSPDAGTIQAIFNDPSNGIPVFGVDSVVINTLEDGFQMQITINANVNSGLVVQQVMNILQNFSSSTVRLFGLAVTELDKQVLSASDLAPSATTTISLVALAVMAVAIVLLIFHFD